MTEELNILFVEDLPTDVELAKRALTKDGLVFQSRVVETEDDYLRELESDLPDIIICDYKMPRFSGMRALTLRLEKYPDVPFVLLTSSINEVVAVECMKVGADDYIIKDNLHRLVPAIRSALAKKTVIRERQEALNNLKESKERMRSLYENSTIGLYRTTLEGKILLANPTLVNMLGYSSFEELAVRNLERDGFEPNYERRQFLELIELNGEVKGFEGVWTKKDGTVVHIRESAKAICDSKGKTLYYDGTVEDVTETRIANELLKESEEKYRLIVENSHDGIEITQDDQMIYANNQFAEMLGYSVEEIKGMKFSQILTEQALKELYERQRKRKDGVIESANQYETTYVKKDESIINVVVKYEIIDYQGKPATFATIQDITQRKLSEEALRESKLFIEGIINSIPVSVFWKDKNLAYLGCNSIFARDAGFTDSKEIIGKDDYQMVWKDQAEQYQSDDRNVIESGESRILFEESQTTPDGNQITLLTSKIPLLSLKGECIGLLGTYMDITDRKLVENSLIESENKFRTIIENSADAIFITNLKGKYVYVNKAATDMLGYTEEQLLGMDITSISVEEEIQLTLDNFSTVLKKGKSFFELNLQKKDGQIIPVDMNAIILNNGLIYGSCRDLSERKQAEQKIKENEEIFNKLMEYSPVHIFFKDENSRFSRLSKSYEKIIKKPLDEVLGKNIHELFPSDIDMEMVEDHKKILLNGEVVKLDEKLNGRYYQTIKFPINIDEKLRYIAGFNIDITDRMMIEEALHESNEFLERLFNYANAPIVVWNDKFIITRFNSAFEALIGKTAKEVIGKPIEVLFPPEKIESSMKLIRQAQASENLKNEEIEILYSDDSVRVVLFNSAVVPGLEEESLATIAQGLDITERIKMEEAIRKSKKEFQTYFDSNSVGLSVTAFDKSWIEVNQKLCDIFGYTKAELKELNWLELTHPDDLAENINLFNQALNGEIDNYNIEKRFFRKDGSIIYIAISSVCQRNNDGSVHHFLTSYNDITERKLAEDAILKSGEKLRALNARLESVKEEERINLSRELHDHLGQNLTGLKMEISYFANKMKKKETFDRKDFLSKAPDLISLIDEMINNVRKISAELRPNVLDYLGLIPAIEWQIDELKKRNNITCMLKSDVIKIDLGVQVNSSIFRIVQEAFTNIIRHSGATKVIVSIKEENDLIKLEILDNGIGIKEEDISNIVSLGILGMKERTLQFNGKLHLENSPQGGTLLTLIIPKAE